MSISVAILGASGYAGGEALRLLETHPAFRVAYLGAHSQAGRALSEVHPNLAGRGIVLGSNDPDALPDEIELVFLALPHGASADVGAELANRGLKVIDLGSDFRLDTPARYAEAYGAPHPLPDELARWVYGLPELFGEALVGATRVAAPGCYPTGVLLGLVPLLQRGLISFEHIVVNSLSGVTGAGRSLREDLLFGAVADGVRAYKIAEHRHRPEMEMGIALATGREVAMTFTPHLIPLQRGMLEDCTVPLLRGDITRATLLEALREAYAGAPFVEVIDEPPVTRWAVGSNRAFISAFVDERPAKAIVIVALDNLIKGAAGQAIQCANIIYGLDQTAGLPRSGWLP